ncbi:Cytoplasmic protein [Bacillus cereus]|nr:Cytoplasmic protein [Bacillus cereus]
MIDGEFSEKQYASYNSLIQNWGHLQQSILQPILDYYKQKRHELGYDVSYNENYPLIETIDQLLERIRIVGIYVLSARRFEGRYIGLTFDCTWDMENMGGFGNLTEKQQLEVLNNPENFTGLSKSANTSKQSKSYEEWTHYKKGTPDEIEGSPDFRSKMITREKQIDDFNKE